MRPSASRLPLPQNPLLSVVATGQWVDGDGDAAPGAEEPGTATLLYAKPRERFEVEAIPLDHPVDRIHSYYRVHRGLMDITLKKVKKPRMVSSPG
mgnify:CR=1 FL=1